jgi:acylphosphatase
LCVRFRILGRVQGVFFRAATREQADRLGLTGHARNLPDGSVEVLACGASDSIAALATWLGHGPPSARVDSVHAGDAADAPPAAFTIG